MEEEQKTELGFSDIMKELGKIMESLQKIVPTQTESEPKAETETETEPKAETDTETEPTPAPQPKPEKVEEPNEETEKTDVGDAEEIDKILKDC